MSVAKEARGAMESDTLCSIDHALGLVIQAWRAETAAIERRLCIVYQQFDDDGNGNLDLQEFELVIASVLESRGLPARPSNEVLKMYAKSLELSEDGSDEDGEKITPDGFLRMSWEFNLNFVSGACPRPFAGFLCSMEAITSRIY